MPRQPKQKTLVDHFTNSSSPVKLKQKPTKKRAPSPKSTPSNYEGSSDDSQLQAFKLLPSSEPIIIDDESDSDGLQPIMSSPVARHKRRQSATQILSDISDRNGSSNSDDDDDEDDGIPFNPRPLKRKNAVVISDDEEQPRKRRVLHRGLKPTIEEENLLEELDDDGNSRLPFIIRYSHRCNSGYL